MVCSRLCCLKWWLEILRFFDSRIGNCERIVLLWWLCLQMVLWLQIECGQMLVVRQCSCVQFGLNSLVVIRWLLWFCIFCRKMMLVFIVCRFCCMLCMCMCCVMFVMFLWMLQVVMCKWSMLGLVFCQCGLMCVIGSKVFG